MVDKVFEDIAAAAQRYTGNARTAIEYGLFQKRVMDRARGAPDYTPQEWLGLSKFVTEDFERIGNFKEVMTYPQMKGFLQNYCLTSQWEGAFKRVHEFGNVVVLELEERDVHNGHQNIVNSVTVYEFDANEKLVHLDVYLQMAPPEGFPIEAYEQ